MHKINTHAYDVINYSGGLTKMFKKVALVALMGLSASSVMAGQWQVKVGGSIVDPTDSTNTALGKVEATREAAFTPSVEYFFNDNVSVELLLANPINHGVKINGAKLLEIKQLPPVLTAKYHFLNSSAFTPYVGIGAVAFIPWDEDEKQGLRDIDARVSVKEDFGFAGQVGVNFKPADAKNWGVFLDVRYAQIKPEVDVRIGGERATKFDLDINPLVYTAGYSYRF